MYSESANLLNSTAPVTGQLYQQSQSPSTCKISSDSLQQHLVESQYGKDTQVFDSYFVPNQMPPRCVACNKLIAEHPHQQQAAAAAYIAIPGAMSNNAPIAVEGLKKNVNGSNNTDVYKKTPYWVFYVIAAFELVLGAAMFVGFTVGGLFQDNGYAATGPSIIMLVGLVFLFVPLNYSMTVDRNMKMIHVHHWRFPFCCCGDQREIPFESVSGQAITLETSAWFSGSNGNAGGFPQQKVVLNYTNPRTGGAEKVDLAIAPMLTSQGVALGWMEYLRECGMNVAQN